jgi:hypothetical protein
MLKFSYGWRRQAGRFAFALTCVLVVAWFLTARRVRWIEVELFGKKYGIWSGFHKIAWQTYSMPMPPSGRPSGPPPDMYGLSVPYLILVIPLALLSAWLLLSKPGKTIAKPTEISE